MTYEDSMKKLGPSELDVLYDRVKTSQALQSKARQAIVDSLQARAEEFRQAEPDPESGLRSVDGSLRSPALSDDYVDRLSSGSLSSDDLELIEVQVTVGSEIQPGVAYYDLVWEGSFTFKGYDLPPLRERKGNGNVLYKTFEGEEIVEIYGEELFVFEGQDIEPDDRDSEE